MRFTYSETPVYGADGVPRTDPRKGDAYLEISETNVAFQNDEGTKFDAGLPGVAASKDATIGRYWFKDASSTVQFDFAGELPKSDADVVRMYTSMR